MVFVEGTVSRDGDPVDIFVGPYAASGRVFIIDQLHHRGGFDEVKTFVGFRKKRDVIRAYNKAYGRISESRYGIGGITELTIEEFKARLLGGGGLHPVSDEAQWSDFRNPMA